MEMKKDNIVKVSIEEDVAEIVSGFGRYQRWQCLLAIVPVICTALSNTNFVFAAAAIDYRCAVPQCEVNNATFATPGWWPTNVSDTRCSRPAYSSNSTCDPGDYDHVEECDLWIYDTRNSIVNEVEQLY
ncbi:uncharacterized protein LOC112044192 [Bicyclus anynana]|uniref:Uncharacterized protein LOC112044192 n=1 Tax=Bicyclus anynana TaxID=110368 RepID=A0ABM3LPA7_BICAN|nr:uncharacterized protein LOC112044192 [Bicyclus anynana]